ncbi:MAG: efflux RND transporter periplasmic adaptor subunit [Planctomycetaceae bacterium]|nr:efflux RND transporter periplasmic adaptor subunit [Planctomycetaceae bacterium]
MAKKIAIPIAVIVIISIGLLVWRARQAAAQKDMLVLYGNVEIRQVDVAFNATERIERMLAEEGQIIQKGQLLGFVQGQRLAAAADQGRAQMLAQRQVLQRLEAGSRPQEIQKARADLAAAQAREKDAALNLNRLQEAVKLNAVSRQDLDNAQAQKDVAQAEVKAANETLALALEGPRKEDIEAARATLQAYTMQWQIALENLADANLISPGDGIIQNRILEPGDMASPQKPAYILSLTDPVWVRVYVPGPELGKLHPGMAAAARTDSFPNKVYEGWVGFISPTAEFTPKSVETEALRTSLVYQVRVYIKNPQNELRLGMPVTVTIDLRPPNNEASE